MPAPVDRDLEHTRAELRAEFLSIADWWLRHVVDLHRGRIHGEVTDRNRRRRRAELGLVYVARLTWFFSAACRYEDRPEWRRAADLCCRVLLEEFRDPVHGGMYWSLDHRGRPAQSHKQVYGQAFAIYALSGYAGSRGDGRALRAAEELFGLLERHARDGAGGGYAEACARDWSPHEGESIDGVVAGRSMNTHLHVLEAYDRCYLERPLDGLGNALESLFELFLARYVEPHGDYLCRFHTEDWEERVTPASFGHDIEASWLLPEIARTLGGEERIGRTRKLSLRLARNVLARGVRADGGVVNEGTADGVTDPRHEWWVAAEAMVGFLAAWRECSEPRFLDASLAAWSFVREHQADRRRGEWLWYARPDRQARNPYKAGPWKGPYHNGRALLYLLKHLPTDTGSRG